MPAGWVVPNGDTFDIARADRSAWLNLGRAGARKCAGLSRGDRETAEHPTPAIAPTAIQSRRMATSCCKEALRLET